MRRRVSASLFEGAGEQGGGGEFEDVDGEDDDGRYTYTKLLPDFFVILVCGFREGRFRPALPGFLVSFFYLALTLLSISLRALILTTPYLFED